MRVYEAKLSYEATLLEVGAKSLSSAELVYQYMKDVLEVHPMNEVFYVILLNRKNRPLGRVAITSGTATAALAHPREISVLRSLEVLRLSSACTTTHQEIRRRVLRTISSPVSCVKPLRRWT
jgi:DNA repair protein RadC